MWWSCIKDRHFSPVVIDSSYCCRGDIPTGSLPVTVHCTANLPGQAHTVPAEGGREAVVDLEEICLTMNEFADLAGLDLGEGLVGVVMGGEEDEEAARAEPQTHEWHVQNMSAPLYPGARLSLSQLCHTLVSEKLKQNLTSSFIERFLRLLSGVLLPEGNTCPRSWYMLKKLIGWRDVEDIQYHVCVQDCHLFPWVHSSKYHVHANDKCPVCGCLRFRTKVKRSGETVYVPQKVFYYFGLHHTVQSHFFSNPVWCSMRGKGRDEFKHDFYGSQEARRLNASVGGVLFHEDNSVYQVGMDFAEPFNTRSYSTGVVGIRCRDIPHAHRSKLAFCAPLAIIPGPAQPKNITPYLELIFNELDIAGREGVFWEGVGCSGWGGHRVGWGTLLLAFWFCGIVTWVVMEYVGWGRGGGVL